ncbi:Universal stress protein family [Alloactinosynnema sp. L-07]|uniref:universal stress protein n=1 Tax=Alloactinosynnema sp. L-07 TaxID=1653480 RepID=UPI00065F0B18|nr:universal stress protein [Alloactinosynnema sp. L-07]CRK57891.1 Universal stress protein family [Alloactinosynnema sp. L-07]
MVVGTDGSYLGDHAVRWAARHADLMGDMLHVYQSTVDDTVAQALLNYPTLPVTHFTDVLDPLSTLVTASADARTIVVGARGKHHPGLGLGHLIRPLVALAACPVVIVKGHPDAIHGHHTTVSVAIGDTADDAPLRCAVGIARGTGATLRILHAGPPAHGTIEWAMDTARSIAPDLSSAATHVPGPHHEIVAKVHDTDLLVIGRGRTPSLGRVTTEALFHAPCPVLVVDSTWQDTSPPAALNRPEGRRRRR